jgi:hypothetical protein
MPICFTENRCIHCKSGMEESAAEQVCDDMLSNLKPLNSPSTSNALLQTAAWHAAGAPLSFLAGGRTEARSTMTRMLACSCYTCCHTPRLFLLTACP